MTILPTKRRYLQDDHCFESEATILAVLGNSIAFDQTCFYPGGGGQPPDEGILRSSTGEAVQIESAQADTAEVIWHSCKTGPPSARVGDSVQLILNKERRLALMRYHTVLHVLNTITRRDYHGWITGVQMNEEYSRIDFRLDNFSPSVAAEFEKKVNQVLSEKHPLRAYFMPEAEFRTRPDLLRTLEAQPPISQGRVRVVEIQGFDAQACGGTHMHNTGEVGRFSIFRMDNKGKNNKRFYVRLT